MNKTAEIKTAIIGYGFSATTFHLPFILSQEPFRFTAVSTSKGAQVKEQYPQVEVYAEAEALLTESDADLVIITAPNNVHFPLAKLALQQGKHVVLEKPFVTRVEQGEELITLAEKQGLVLSVYHNRRWDGDFLTVQKLIADGRLGPVRYFESHFDRFRPEVRKRWRESAVEGGGILFDLAPHLLDQALQLFGPPTAITARVHTLRTQAEADDFFHITLHYPERLAILRSSPFCAAPNLRFEVQGETGSYVKHGLDPQEERLKSGLQPINEGWAQENAEQYGHLYTADGAAALTTETGGYQHYYQQLASAILDGGEVPVSAEQALWNIRLIHLALQSSASGQTVALAELTTD
ncbi:oxidoreductase [Microbulbifer hydrolyticus]|uniref:Dehydrogenase n=1 Tax=Microbulbifer hydrolyticus TaxID=48074 RepID=A0A6P1TDE4_9GAMM|nr:oxidoreductase [Microbulbifer hydrolyticus]MBB5211983.1 putative dehydrogenase [Microbulbifer hydrolyticus]QHQ39666.1 oxidoreductase [Microbulbifer hydrolyticus]